MARRRQDDPPAGSPAWMATFSDLMNLLLCFFVLLFSMSTVDEEKYNQLVASITSAFSILDLSHEKLTFEEIIAIYTYIERADHHGGDGEVSDRCVQDGTFSNLSKRLNEIKKDR